MHTKGLRFIAKVFLWNGDSLNLKKKVIALLKMRCPKRMILQKKKRKTGKVLLRKDLDNIARALHDPEADMLTGTLDLLLNTYLADCSLLHDKGEFLGLYFTTSKIRENMKQSTEIIFTDGTYKLFKRKFVLQLFMVEDMYECSQIVGVGLLANERKIVKWLFECFANSHRESCEKIRSFMTDKNLVERSVINEVFGHVKTLLCQFHTKQTFKRKVPVKYQEVLNKMCDSSSESTYNKYYEEFCEMASNDEDVLSYFNHNWHPIRLQWTTFGMNGGVHLGNFTNNRTESTHTKLKVFPWMKPQDLMRYAVENLIEWTDNRDEQMEIKRGQDAVKRDAMPFPPDSVEYQYQAALTPFVFCHIHKEIKQHISIDLITKDSTTLECTMRWNGEVMRVTPTECACSIWSAKLMVCRHILAAREFFNMPLFEEKLCGRWALPKKCQADKIMDGDGIGTLIENVENISIVDDKPHISSSNRNEFSVNCNAIIDIAKINLPPTIKMIGRMKKSDTKCTPKKYGKRKTIPSSKK